MNKFNGLILLILTMAIVLLACTLSITSRTNPSLTSQKMPPFIAGGEAFPSWSPDGQRLVFECYPTQSTVQLAEVDICKSDLDGGHLVQLTKDRGLERYPAWSPDGNHIAFRGRNGFYLMTPDGHNKRQLSSHFLAHDDQLEEADKPQWSPDSRSLLFSAQIKSKTSDIHLVDIPSGKMINLTQDNGRDDLAPMWVPDGTKIVFLSKLSESRFPDQVRMINIDGQDEQVLVEEQHYQPRLAVSKQGQLAYSTMGNVDLNQPKQLHVLDLMTKQITEIDLNSQFYLDWSPNGETLVYSLGFEFKLFKLHTETTRQLPTSDFHFVEASPRWSQDGNYIALSLSTFDKGSPKKHLFIYNHAKRETRLLFR